MKKRALKTATAFILAASLILSGGGIEKCGAAVSDNIGIAKIEEKLGSYSDSADAHSLFGVIWSIFNCAKDVFEKVTSLETKIDSLAMKMDGISSGGGAVAADYSLFVYIPKASAATNYTGQTVNISSSSGAQTAVATLADDGTNYSAELNFKFKGECNLSYNMLDSNDNELSVSSVVTISESNQEQQLGLGLGNANELSWAEVHMVLQNDLDSYYGLTTIGKKLCGSDWFVMKVFDYGSWKTLELWQTSYMGDTAMRYDPADTLARDCENTFNSEAGMDIVFESYLPFYDDVKDYVLPYEYWLSDFVSNDVHAYMTRDNTIGNAANGPAFYCLPCVSIY